jgi:hypothetical protein
MLLQGQILLWQSHHCDVHHLLPLSEILTIRTRNIGNRLKLKLLMRTSVLFRSCDPFKAVSPTRWLLTRKWQGQWLSFWYFCASGQALRVRISVCINVMIITSRLIRAFGVGPQNLVLPLFTDCIWAVPGLNPVEVSAFLTYVLVVFLSPSIRMPEQYLAASWHFYTVLYKFSFDTSPEQLTMWSFWLMHSISISCWVLFCNISDLRTLWVIILKCQLSMNESIFMKWSTSLCWWITVPVVSSYGTLQWSQDSSVSIVTWLQTGRLGFDPWQRQRIFVLVSVSKLALGPTQPPIQ